MCSLWQPLCHPPSYGLACMLAAGGGGCRHLSSAPDILALRPGPNSGDKWGMFDAIVAVLFMLAWKRLLVL
eukprot:354371-Chlamydomonas_euryale.AAC.1